jgi:GDPmannose 4,6-dehydratase
MGKIKIEALDLVDGSSIGNVIAKVKPDEVYNIASQSVPADSWTHPIYTGEVTALGVVRVLEAVRMFAPKAKVYQASSREIFGNVSGVATEGTLLDANNPYGIAKAYGHMIARCYRESYGLFVCSGILFNHESPRRSLHFVSRKISAGVACIKNKVGNPPLNESGEPLVDSKGKLHLGDLTSYRDWGYAPDYVEAMWLMLQNKKPRDYVIGTKEDHTVSEFCELAFRRAGLNWKDHVVSDKKFFRPTEIKRLVGDYSLAKKDLGWKPQVGFKELVNIMVDADLKMFK